MSIISQTDKNFKEMLEEALAGELVTNRTGTKTLSVLGVQKRYDLRNGFPIVQAKQTFWKKAVAEMLWFMSGECDNLAGLRDMGAENIWKPWADQEGNLNRIYGLQWIDWVSERKIVTVERRVFEENSDPHPTFPVETLHKNHDFCGKKFQSNNFGPFVVFRLSGKDKEARELFDIQFEKTGFVVRGVRKDVVLDGRVKDPYLPKTFGVGFLGEPKRRSLVSKELYKKLYKTWHHMIDRCYNESCKEFKYYGAKGVYVCKRWLCFANFLDDCSKLPNWYLKRKNPDQYQLDKDYYSSNCYHPKGCVWLSRSDQMVYRDARPFLAKKDGFEKVFISKAHAKQELGASKVGQVLNGSRKTSNGFSFSYIKSEAPRRYSLPINQLKEAEKAIKAGSDSRRIIVSAWQPAELQDMALPPCHVLFQFTVRSGGLYLHLYQRSCDLPIGGPFNVAQYSALLMMMAKVSGLEAREFIHTIHDAHIYEDQVPAVQQWIDNATDLDSGNSMTEVKRPRMVIQDRKQESFEDFELSDFSMEDYTHMGKIKIPVAV